DPRFSARADGTLEPADREQEVPLPPEVRGRLDALLPALLEQWRAAGRWTARQVTEALARLGWAGATERGGWLQARSRLGAQEAVVRVGQDYWLPADLLPQGPAKTRLQVVPVRGLPPGPTGPPGTGGLGGTEQASRSTEADPLVPADEAPSTG